MTDRPKNDSSFVSFCALWGEIAGLASIESFVVVDGAARSVALQGRSEIDRVSFNKTRLQGAQERA